jgi:hypothetical protein
MVHLPLEVESPKKHSYLPGMLAQRGVFITSEVICI